MKHLAMTTKMKSRLGLGFAVALALGSAACGPAVPAQPDFNLDVLPIFEARCIRCHDGGRTDPSLPPKTPGTPRPATPIDFRNVDLVTSAGFKTLIVNDITGKTNKMPPPPAAPLEDWQLKTLENFLK